MSPGVQGIPEDVSWKHRLGLEMLNAENGRQPWAVHKPDKWAIPGCMCPHTQCKHARRLLMKASSQWDQRLKCRPRQCAHRRLHECMHVGCKHAVTMSTS